jgi:hypothetical protein
MRFSSLFEPTLPQREALREPPLRDDPPPPPATELPEDLDARVRLVGEWQLGEA